MTNPVRGLLCDTCNLSLGGFKDSTEMLQRAVNYVVASQKLVKICEEVIR